MKLCFQIEAFLFWKGESVRKRELTRVFGVNLVAINDAIGELRAALDGHGVVIVETEEEIALSISSEAGDFIERFRKEDLSSPLSKAALETLSIILYKNRASRKEIEYIRGVNSVSILRTLLVRGLITRDEEGENRFSYHPTVDLLNFLGLKRADDLPEYSKVAEELRSASEIDLVEKDDGK